MPLSLLFYFACQHCIAFRPLGTAIIRSHGVRDVSPNGVLGDPEGASGAEGERFIAEFVDDLVLAIEGWRPIDPTPASVERDVDPHPDQLGHAGRESSG